MRHIGNINNSYINSNKRISGKLQFNAGEKLTGRIINKDETNSVIIRLLNGWEIEGELEGIEEGFENFEGKLARFQIEGFENGKLKLKILPNSSQGEKVVDQGELLEVISKEWLDIEDIPILNKMLKFSMPLTRENIKEVKSLIDFQQKILDNPDQIDTFITKYFNSQGIEGSKEQSNALKEFFHEFKTLTNDDILTFMENDVEFTKENIESFKRIIKGNNENITKAIKSIESAIKQNFELSDKVDLNQGVEVPLKDNTIIGDQNIDETLKSINKENNQIIANTYIKNESVNSKIHIMELLKNISNSNDEATGILKEENEGLNNTQQNKLEDIVEVIKTSISSNKLEKSMVEKIVSQVTKKEVVLTEEEFKEIVKLLKEDNEFKDLKNKEVHNQRESNIQVKEAIKEKIIETKNIIKNILSQLESNEEIPNKFIDLIKSNISDVKLFNKFSNEYYYFDMPINIREDEYPCKLIVKDNRKNGKKIDSTNIKLIVTVDTKNLGIVDSYITVKNKSMNIHLKCDKEIVPMINLGKVKLKKVIEDLGYNVKIEVSNKLEDINIVSCREFFNENNITNIDIKV